MTNNKFNVPILLIGFNRPESINKVINAIRMSNCTHLYVSIDGPRLGVASDHDLILEVHKLILNIDWCENIYYQFHETNLGPMHSQLTAINWFFSCVEEGIILEDDCIPDQSFFNYCKILLARFRDNQKIYMISGNNFQNGKKYGNGDYYFSIFPHIWGWASWRRAWNLYDPTIKDWPKFKNNRSINNLHMPKLSEKFWSDIFDNIYDGNFTRGWDYRFAFSCWVNDMLCVLPNTNLVRNIGFNEFGTNCHSPRLFLSNIPEMSVGELLSHPKKIEQSIRADKRTSRIMFQNRNTIQNIIFYFFNPSHLYLKLLQLKNFYI